MSKDIDDLMKQVVGNTINHQEQEQKLSLDIAELKKGIKNIEKKINLMDQTLEKLFDILNTISVLIEESDYHTDTDDDVEDWTPYNEDNYSYDEEDTYGLYEDYEQDSDE
jgi:hypothetical protein